MRFVLFYHSVRSDWNHGNAHFLRGVASELQSRGHVVRIFEPSDAWSAQNLAASHGEEALSAYRAAYPTLRPVCYDPAALDLVDLDNALRGTDVVIVHEWNPPELIARIGRHRARGGRYSLLFHDTHHRSVTDSDAMAAFDLSAYDGVLAFGDVIRRLYLKRGWARRAYTWHEAADTRVFYPRAPRGSAPQGDLVWIGNWGDEERSRELHEFLVNPVKELGLKARVYGVRYPEHALAALKDAGIEYGGYLPNHEVPEVFAAHKVTVHVPRRAYTTLLPGIPTIRPFEALACGIPLISAPWQDAEGLFSPGRGRNTITARHTCAHRTDELLRICRELMGAREQDALVGGVGGTS
jgi:spore maturation protein CgeB